MKTKLNRRGFLHWTAASLAFPTIIPSSALGRDGAISPGDRIVMGFIGTGGQGRGLLGRFLSEKEVQVTTVCDVDNSHRQMAVGMVNKKYDTKDCGSLKDFRELLAKKDLDAVCIATPDHWHALASVAAA